MIWLLRRLQPDDKSIAEFRQNGGAITETCAELVGWARSVGLVRGEWVGDRRIDRFRFNRRKAIVRCGCFVTDSGSARKSEISPRSGGTPEVLTQILTSWGFGQPEIELLQC